MKWHRYVSLLTVLWLTGCTIVVLPRPTDNAHQTSMVYLAINRSAEPVTVTPSVAAPVAPSKVAVHPCTLQAPSFSDVPMLPPIPADQQGNHQLVENTLVDYILVLRHYIHQMVGRTSAFYEHYQTQCATSK